MNKDNFLKKTFKFIFGCLKGYLISIGLFVTLLPLMMLIIVNWKGEPKSLSDNISRLGEQEKVVLKLNLSGSIGETSPDQSEILLSQLLGGSTGVRVSELRTAVRRAVSDDRVLAVFVSLDQLSGPLASFDSIRRALEPLKTSGKPLHFFINGASTETLFLASLADAIVSSPVASFEILGPSFQLLHMKEGLDKIGIDFQVVKAGVFKSAVEPFTEKSPSQATLEMYSSLEKNIRNHLAEAIAEGRKKPVAEVQGWFQQSLYTAEEAKSVGMIDHLFAMVQAEESLKESVNAENVINMSDYLLSTTELDLSKEDHENGQIALIEAEGEITMASKANRSSGFIVPKDFIKEIHWAKENPEVKAVVIRITSPGGSAVASDIIWHEVQALRELKPVVISMGSMAASGGYYIASAGSHLVAEPTTLTGSIGVFALIPNGKKLAEKLGLSFHMVSESHRSRLIDFGQTASSEDMAILNRQVRFIYDKFLSRVAEGRKMELNQVTSLAEGRVFTGIEAKDKGLVDELGGLQEAFDQAKIAAQLDPAKLYPIVRYRGDILNFAECLSSAFSLMECINRLEGGTTINPLTRFSSEWPFPLTRMADFLIDNRLLAYWPHPVMGVW